MNNRYICRGKRKDNGEWVTGYYVFQRKRSGVFGQKISELDFDRHLIIDLRGNSHEVIPETVVRCTGLKDKNGKPIFEGYIVESRASENKEDWKRWVVQFTDGSFCFEREIPRKRKYKHEQNLLGIDNIELYGLTVIGSIHDNPELLQRSDEE